MIEPRQTLGYVRNLLAQHGVSPKSKLGQSFLIDLNLLDLLVGTAELTKDELALEVGSGTGSLTARLAEQAGAVVSIELDADLHHMVQETLGDKPNTTLLHGDALRNKNELNPRLISALIEARDRHGCKRLKLVANLPFAVATPVLANFLIGEIAFERMVATVQWEIAERLTAQPGTSAYGALAVLVQSLADVYLVRRLAPSVFWPRPQVDSAIVHIKPDPARRVNVGGVVRFRHFLRDLYSHRRKNLRGALIGWPSGRRDKGEVDAKLRTLGIDGTVRAEALDLEQHLRLCREFG